MEIIFLLICNSQTRENIFITLVGVLYIFQPFGDGLVTAVMSTLRRGENSLFLWNNSNLEQPVYQFVGHNDVVLEFQWRKKDECENPTVFLYLI